MAQDQNQPQDDFSEIALAKFLTAFPELGNLIVTFNDLSHELSDDNGMQVGVFILRSGPEIFYVPCVAKDSNVYPVDSIFFASKSQFFPLTKKTIGIILTSNHSEQGKGTKIPPSVVINPDLTTLVNPPRTGKFVQASASHLSDFMAELPDHLKRFTMEKFAEEKSIYENLHKMFAIKDIFAALQVQPKGMAAKVTPSPVSLVTGAVDNPSDQEVSDIMSKGYAVRGVPEHTRIAVCMGNDTRFTEVVELDGGKDHEVVFKNGTSREAFIPKNVGLGDQSARKRSTAAIFTDGDWANSPSYVAKGESLGRTTVLDNLFKHNPPVLPKDIEVNDTFAILDTDANLVGIFNARRVTISNLGVEIRAGVECGALPRTEIVINAYKNYGMSPTLTSDGELFVRYASLVIKLKENVSYDLERTAQNASRRNEISQIALLGEELNLGFDGVEFIIDGKVVGQEKQAMQRLVVEESIDPELAQSFIKQAREKKFTKIYLTKKAGTSLNTPGEIPQFGEIAPPPPKTGLNGSFIPNVQKSTEIGDAQTTEATIISELLQTPDTYEMIEQYLPDIEQAVDRLGRILLLSRVHIAELSEDNDTESLMSFLANLKSVYRMLGDNLVKLQELVALKPNEKK